MTKRKISDRESMKNILNQEIEEDVPFGGAPEYYKYRCSHCHFENTMNEANVDVASGWTKKRTKCSRGLMPVLECPIENVTNFVYE